MVPMVGDARQAEIIVQSGKYPPWASAGPPSRSPTTTSPPARSSPKSTTPTKGLLIAQIENRPGLENVDRIAALDGIDVLWIGGFDLSNFLGIPGQFDHEFTAALDRVVDACRRYGKATGYLVNSIEEGQLRLRQGFRLVAYGGDLWLYRRALREGIEGLRQGVWPWTMPTSASNFRTESLHQRDLPRLRHGRNRRRAAGGYHVESDLRGALARRVARTRLRRPPGQRRRRPRAAPPSPAIRRLPGRRRRQQHGPDRPLRWPRNPRPRRTYGIAACAIAGSNHCGALAPAMQASTAT